MKKKVLAGSVGCISLATVVGVGAALLATDPFWIARFTTVCSLFGIGSIGLFFVGLITPE